MLNTVLVKQPAIQLSGQRAVMHEVDPEVVVSEGMRVLLMRALSDSLRIGYESESFEVGRSQKGESRHDYLV